MQIEFSFDDGLEEDLQIIKMLDQYRRKAIFYIPIHSWGMHHLDEYRNHEIGCHTISHPQNLKLLSTDNKAHEILDARQALRAVSRQEVNSFCYPRGRYDDECVEWVMSAGFTNARTTRVLETAVTDQFRKGTTIHIFPRKEYNNRHWLEIAKEILKSKPPYFHVWGHSREIIEIGELDNFANFLKLIGEDRTAL